MLSTPSVLQRSYTINKLVGPLSDQFIERVKHNDPNILIQAAQARNLFPTCIIPPISLSINPNPSASISTPVVLKCDSPF
jgi:hypothetical protein